MDKLEEIGLISNPPGQIVTFPSDIFSSNNVMFTSDGAAILGSDGLVMGDMGFSLVSIPVQILQDTTVPIQQQQYVTTEVVPEMTTIYIDQNQLAYLSNGQFVITEDGLLASTGTSVEQETIEDKDTLLFTSSSNAEADSNKSINDLGLGCIEEPEVGDLLLEEVADTTVNIYPLATDQFITGPEVTWADKSDTVGTPAASSPKANNTASTSVAPQAQTKDKSKDVPPPLRKGPFKCDICMEEFSQYSQFRKHSQFHLEDKPHKCPSCPAAYNNEFNLVLHSAIHKVNCLECPECHKTFNRVASLKNHVTMHQREESLFCTECGDEFRNQVQLDKHMEIHDEEWVKPAERVYQCPNCDKQYSRASVLKQHMKDHFKVKAALSFNSYNRAVRKGRTLHSCTVCKKTFQKPSQLIRHNRIHTGERPFKCDQCTRSFSQKGSLLIHMMSKHKGLRPYTCQFCSAAFSQKGNLRAHVVRLHSIPNNQETVYQCNECSCVFRKLGSLNAHTNRMHPPANPAAADKILNELSHLKLKAQMKSQSKDTSDKENDGQEDKFQQRIITVSNELEDGVIKHTTMTQRLVGKFKWHQCNYCGKEFKKPSDLVRHTRMHTQEKPFKCKLCNQGFSLRSTLTTHMRSHNNNKQYSCKLCGKVLPSARELKQHRRSEHGVNNTKKDVSLTIDQSGTLLTSPLVLTEQGNDWCIGAMVVTVQPKTNNADRPHRCTVCGQSYRKASNLKIHLRTHSGERPYACTLCPRTCTSASVLKSHMRTHTMLKTHRCNECGKYLSTKSSLRRHLETHTEMYMCFYCYRKFKSKARCNAHIKTHEVVQLEGDQIVVEDNVQLEAEEEVPEEGAGMDMNVCLDMPNIEALIVNRSNMVLTSEEPFVVSTVGEVGEGGMTQTLLADASGTITLSNLTGQNTLSQESIREIEESLNTQLFCTNDLNLDKEQVVLFDQGFEPCVFPSITLQGEQLELGQALTSENLVSILPPADKNDKTFSCEHCDFHCQTNSELESHQVCHLQKDCLVEPQTITLVNTDIQLEEDIAAANLPSIDTRNESDFRCDVCGLDCETREALATHRASHSSCEICEKTFATTAQYKAHIKSHGREKEYVCEHCGSSFSQMFSLTRHKAIHNPDDKTHECNICGQTFRTERQLRRHSSAEHHVTKARRRTLREGQVRQLTEEEAQNCATLEATSVSEHILKASIAERDRISDVKDPDMYKNEPVHANQCKYCPKSFRKPSDLVRHLRIHTGERPYQCDFCCKCFTVKSTLDCHLKTHKDQKRCICHVCGYDFSTLGSLKVHMRLHTGSRPFRCPVCFQRFRTSGHRKAHLMQHIREAQSQLVETAMDPSAQVDTNTPPPSTLPKTSQYQCSVCSKTFTKLSFLVRHSKVHAGEKNLQCKACDESFSDKHSLDSHLCAATASEKQWTCSECDLRFSQKSVLLSHIKRHHPFVIDLSEEKLVDLDRVVRDLFPNMKSDETTTSLI